MLQNPTHTPKRTQNLLIIQNLYGKSQNPMYIPKTNTTLTFCEVERWGVKVGRKLVVARTKARVAAEVLVDTGSKVVVISVDEKWL